MPQIGELGPGVWLASGFGGHGLNTTAMAGNLIARAIVKGDQTWRQFTPFELVWAGGDLGRAIAQVYYWTRRLRERPSAGRRRRDRTSRARRAWMQSRGRTREERRRDGPKRCESTAAPRIEACTDDASAEGGNRCAPGRGGPSPLTAIMNRRRPRNGPRRPKCKTADGSPAFSSRHECQPLEQMNVLFVLDQRAVQRRDQLLRIALAQRLDRNILDHQKLEPVEQFGG